jgi:hypothetical protein
MNFRSHFVEDTIDNCIKPAMKLAGGKLSISIQVWLQETFGNKHTRKKNYRPMDWKKAVIDGVGCFDQTMRRQPRIHQSRCSGVGKSHHTGCHLRGNFSTVGVLSGRANHSYNRRIGRLHRPRWRKLPFS